MHNSKTRKSQPFVDIPHYVYQHLSGIELLVYMILRCHRTSLKRMSRQRLFRKYRIDPSTGRKVEKRLLNKPVRRELDPKLIYLTKKTPGSLNDGPSQDMVYKDGCTAVVPMIRIVDGRYTFPHDYQHDTDVANDQTGRVHGRRWYLDSYISHGPRSNGYCYAATATIAKRAGMSPKSRDKVCRHLKTLVSNGLLHRGYVINDNGKVTAAYFVFKELLESAIRKGKVCRNASVSRTSIEHKAELEALLQVKPQNARAA